MACNDTLRKRTVFFRNRAFALSRAQLPSRGGRSSTDRRHAIETPRLSYSAAPPKSPLRHLMLPQKRRGRPTIRLDSPAVIGIFSAPMKHAPMIAGILLGLLFVMSSVVVLFNLVDAPPPPAGTPAALFMGAFLPTGYMTFIKVLELVGGILVAIPRTRNFGLLVLGPIIVNILAFHAFLMKGEGLFNPMINIIVLLALYLLWVGRRAFAGLLN